MNIDALRERACMLSALRQWFDTNGYLEIHTPVLVPVGAMEPYIEPVQVGSMQLHTSPEFAMKRVLAAGLPRIYQVVPCFREEEEGRHHSREFTMIEWYRVGAGTVDLMGDVEDLIGTLAEAMGREAPMFQRIPVDSLLEDRGDPDDWFMRWVSEVEPKLQDPTFVYDYPEWQSALSRRRDGVADRFEVYLGGIEVGNAFAEELNSREIRSRWEENNRVRESLDRPPHPVDSCFLQSVDRMPRCAGIAIGLDRLMMALGEYEDIANVQVRSTVPR